MGTGVAGAVRVVVVVADVTFTFDICYRCRRSVSIHIVTRHHLRYLSISRYGSISVYRLFYLGEIVRKDNGRQPEIWSIARWQTNRSTV